MLDLRTASIKIKPSDSKEKDYHLALAEYLYKELKHNGINVKKHNVSLRVTLSNKFEDKYEHVVIDCLEGRIYLRGKQVKDRYFGKLRRFQANGRISDAYHCVAQSVTRIVNRIKRLQDKLNQIEREVLADMPQMLDLRKKVERVDMRVKVASIQRIDMRKVVARVDLRRKVVSQPIDMRRKVTANIVDMRKTAKVTPQQVQQVLENIKPSTEELKQVAPQLQGIDQQTMNQVVQDATKLVKEVQHNPEKFIQKTQQSANELHDLANQVSNQAQQIDPSIWQQIGIDKNDFISSLNVINDFANIVLQNSDFINTIVSSRRDLRKTAKPKDLRKKVV